MSVVIIGGNECMVCRYQEICKKNGYKAKVFAQEAKKNGVPVLHVHSSSASALQQALESRCVG